MYLRGAASDYIWQRGYLKGYFFHWISCLNTNSDFPGRYCLQMYVGHIKYFKATWKKFEEKKKKKGKKMMKIIFLETKTFTLIFNANMKIQI